MLLEYFRSWAIVGHWYPIMSIDFHEHAMTSMMVLRQVYALGFLSSDARKPCQGMDYPRWGCQWNLEGEWLHGRGDQIPEGLCSKEGKVTYGFVLVISISIRNQMHIESAPSNNVSVIVHWEDKWRGIIMLDIGCRFDFAVDSRLPGKEVDPGITLRVEVWAFGFPYYGYMHCIILFAGWENVHVYVYMWLLEIP